MSALTKADIGVIARQRIGAPVSARPRFEALVDAAVKSLAQKIAARADFTELQKEVAVSCVNGVITVSDDTLLLDTLAPPRGSLLINSVVAKPVRNFKALKARRDRSHYWYALQGRKIYVANVETGATGAAGGGGGIAGVLTCNYQPTLAQFPPRYDEEIIGEVIELAGGAENG